MNARRTDLRHCVKLNGKSYTCDSGAWYETKTILKPPVSVISELNKLLLPLLEEEDAKIKDFDTVLERAKKAREFKQYERAVNLARRALDLHAHSAGAAAVLSSCLRAIGRSQEALMVTGRFNEFTKYAPLLNTRAAALCDLGRWEDAKEVVGRALAIGTDKEESFQVVNRIKAAKPELYN